MSDYPIRVPILFAALLGIVLCVFFLPISVGWMIIGCAVISFITGIALWRLRRYKKRLAAATADIQSLAEKLDALPARQRFRLPILLVTGPASRDYFQQESEPKANPATRHEANSHRSEAKQGNNKGMMVSADAVWIQVDEFAQLPIVFDSLVARWPDMLGRIGLFFALAPEIETKKGLFIAKLQAFRQAWVDTCRIAKYPLPVYLATHLGLNNIQYQSDMALPVYWYQVTDSAIYLVDDYHTPLCRWVYAGQPENLREYEQKLALQALLHYGQQWLLTDVLPILQDSKQRIAPCKPVAMAIYPLHRQRVANNLWQTGLHNITTLMLPNSEAIQNQVTVPDELVKSMPIATPFTPLKKSLCYTIMILALFAIGCLWASHWNNQKLMVTVAEDINQYDRIAMDSYAEKAQALARLKSDRELLNQYFIQGEPVKLGLGLYSGQQLIEPLNQAISRYVPQPIPEPPIVYVEVPVVKEREVIRLDSLALFESGQAVLKPDSTKVLVDALINIKAKAGWLILISGHTDSVGDDKNNQQLSLARATAVRDWMIKASDIPENCFAITGYGAKQPLARNETPEGRAKNRRVEISLVPQASACQRE